MNERSNTGSSTAYTPNMNMPSRKKGNRAALGLILTLLLPPVGLAYLWRAGVFRTRGRLLLTLLATIEMALLIGFIMPDQKLSSQAPMPVAPVAATLSPDDGTLTALSNLDQLLAEEQARRDAEAGITPEPTEDTAAYEAEQEAIKNTTVYTVFSSGARYFHRDTVCGTQSNRRALTVREAISEGLGACPDCNPPVPYA